MCHTSSEAPGPTPQMAPTLTIITGAQTGIDTAAIEAATRLKLPYEGWVPLGYTNETGTISSKYRTCLRETPTPNNAQRTEWNVRDSNMVLTILRGPPENVAGGTAWGVNVAREANKDLCFVDLGAEWSGQVDKLRTWLGGRKLQDLRCVINGPRESEEPGIEEEATRFLCEALAECQAPSSHGAALRESIGG